MVVTFVVVCCLTLRAVSANQIFQKDILDEITLDISAEANSSSNGAFFTENKTVTESFFASQNLDHNSTSQLVALYEDNTSENMSSESISETSEDKSDDENGETRDDSRGSEENARKRWIRVFKLNLKSEEDSSVREDSSEESQSSDEETQEINDSETSDSNSEDSDSVESDERDESESSQSQSDECNAAVNNGTCESDERSLDIGDDTPSDQITAY